MTDVRLLSRQRKEMKCIHVCFMYVIQEPISPMYDLDCLVAVSKARKNADTVGSPAPACPIAGCPHHPYSRITAAIDLSNPPDCVRVGLPADADQWFWGQPIPRGSPSVHPPRQQPTPHLSSRTEDAMTTQQWQDIVKEKQAEAAARIPQAWRLPPEVTASISENASTNVLDVPRQSGLLSLRQLDITENYDATALLEQIHCGTLTSLEVAEAFCIRAAIAQQVVRGCLHRRLMDNHGIDTLLDRNLFRSSTGTRKRAGRLLPVHRPGPRASARVAH